MLVAGDSFHGLKLRELCGRGGFGEVWLCEDISGKVMALKVIPKDGIHSDWRREFKGMKDYRKITENASCLLQIFSVSEDDKYFFYTMEAADSSSSDSYIPDTLAARLKKGPLHEGKLWSVFTDIFRAVERLHKKGFVHRDIKPDNIVFVNGKAKLADIGLVAPLDVTVTQAAFTQVYLPPEAASHPEILKDKKMLPKFDIYAFGKVIYCSVTGNPPEDFPSVPANLNITNCDRARLFYNFSRQICETDPLQRMDSVKDVSNGLARIGKALHTRDFWNYGTGNAMLKLKYLTKSVFCNTGIWLSKYGIFILFLVVIISLLMVKLDKVTENNRNLQVKVKEEVNKNEILKVQLEDARRNQAPAFQVSAPSWYQQTKEKAVGIYRKAKGFFRK